MPANILVVDDEPLKRITLQIELAEQGYQVFEAADAPAARRIFDSQPIDAVVTDVRMPGMSGMDLLTYVKQTRPEVPVILMTAYATVDTAVLAIKRGAHDYITKPFTTPDLLVRLDRLFAGRDVSGGGRSTEHFGPLLARSGAMRLVFEQLRAATEHERPVLICGDTGVGKTVLAEQVHRLGSRASRPFSRVPCAGAVPAELEAELFGAHTTDDMRDKPGRLEATARGTLLLEDVDELPQDLQARLLHAIGDSKGDTPGERSPRSEVRLICSTRRDLVALIGERLFREDLYYRISAVQITIPPLRERPDDIALLAQHFLERHQAPGSADASRLSPHTADELARYSWPGNVRELENCITRALALAGAGEIRPEHVLPLGAARDEALSPLHYETPENGKLALTETVTEIEKRMILMALRQCSGNQARAATRLGIPRTTLRDKMAKYSIASD